MTSCLRDATAAVRPVGPSANAAHYTPADAPRTTATGSRRRDHVDAVVEPSLRTLDGYEPAAIPGPCQRRTTTLARAEPASLARSPRALPATAVMLVAKRVARGRTPSNSCNQRRRPAVFDTPAAAAASFSVAPDARACQNQPPNLRRLRSSSHASSHDHPRAQYLQPLR